MSLWGGRFEQASDPLFRAFNDSLSFDRRLVHEDVAGSIAWAGAIRRAGVLAPEEHARLVEALQAIGAEAARDPRVLGAAGDEDIHSWVEARLVERVGPLGKKLHTGRSRNDQVATDLRLWTIAQLGARIQEIDAARAALLRLARREIDTVFPGYTHLQRAQPVLLAHWSLAYDQMLRRDRARFNDSRARAGECPLGSGALAGAAFAIDRLALARDLGFAGPTANSLDAVSDRDFVVESLGAAALCAIHLSRLAEDLVIYTTGEFALLELGDRVTSGSSLMPQKKNPDALELIRGKCGRILGAHTAICTTLKGLPLAYNKDMQEDKEPLFDAMDQLSMCLRVTPVVLDSVRIDRDACLRAARGGHSNATELADHLVERGVPFREAHEAAGRVVRVALSKGCAIEELSLDALQAVDARIDRSVYPRLTIESTLARRDVPGGTAPGRVREALDAADHQLQSEAAK